MKELRIQTGVARKTGRGTGFGRPERNRRWTLQEGVCGEVEDQGEPRFWLELANYGPWAKPGPHLFLQIHRSWNTVMFIYIYITHSCFHTIKPKLFII